MGVLGNEISAKIDRRQKKMSTGMYGVGRLLHRQKDTGRELVSYFATWPARTRLDKPLRN